MSIPLENYYQNDMIQKRNILKIKNDNLDTKLTTKRKEWLFKSNLIMNKLIKMDLHNNRLINPVKINELEGEALVLHEELRKEMSKMINQLGKAINSKKISTDDTMLFYSLKVKELNIGRSSKNIDIMVSGVNSEKKRTCMLLEVFIDFLDELKDIVYSFKFKIKRTINNVSYIDSLPLKFK